MLLDEENDTSDGDLLFIERIAKEITIAVNVQTTGTGIVRSITHTDCFRHDLPPIHVITMVIQGHRMADDLKAVIEASIVLAVDTFFIRVGNLANFFCVIVSFAAFIDFQFHSHKQRA